MQAHVSGSAAEHDDAVAEQNGFIEVMRHQDGAYPATLRVLPEADQLTLKHLARHRIDGAKGLVKQQHLRAHRQRPRQANPLLHPAGEFVRVARRMFASGP